MQGTDTHRALPKLAALVLVVIALGLPINNLYVFALLAAGVLVVFTGAIRRTRKRWAGAALLTALTLAAQVFLPAPRIEEGHNVFLVDGPGGALENGLPRAAYQAMAERFEAAYPAERRCPRGEIYCWRPRGIPDRAFAFAADGVFDGHDYSRRVTGVGFRNPVWLRLGVINDGSLDIFGKTGDVERMQRDRRSLAIFDRWHLRLPFFVMYRFPADFAGSDLCWRGEVLWEGAAEQFERLENKDWGCRTLQSADAGRRVFGLSIGPDADLAMSLDANAGVKLRRLAEAATTAIGAIGILLLLVRWQPRRAVFPLILTAFALLVVALTDVTFIGGFRPLDAGDDGLVYSGFARTMLAQLVHGDLAGALGGGERVFVFTPGMRYFRAIEYLAFGDTFLAYLGVMLLVPLLVHALARRFLGVDWAIVFALAFVVTPAGVLFGTSYLNYATIASRGFGDPLAVAAFVAGLVLLIARPAPIAHLFWAAVLTALAVILRPNLAPAAGVMLGGTGLMLLAQWRIARLAALCAGFLPIFLPLWHNWYFGHAIVPFSDTVTVPVNYVMPVSVYVAAFGDLIRLDLTGEHLGRVLGHLVRLLSGPSELWMFAPLHLAALALVARVATSRRYEPMLRLVALSALALFPLGLFYAAWLRYHLLMWLLCAVVVAAWFKCEGAAAFDRLSPGWTARSRRWAAAAGIPRAVAWLKGFAEPNAGKAA